MSVVNRSPSAAGELLLTLVIASFGTGLAIGVGVLLNGFAIGAEGPLLTVPALTIAAPLAGTLGAIVLLPVALLLSLT